MLLVLLLVCSLHGKKTVIEKSEGIYILTEQNYDSAVKQFEFLFVYFYAPWYSFRLLLPIHLHLLLLLLLFSTFSSSSSSTFTSLSTRCGHCKALGPEFVKAGQLLKERDSAVKFAKVRSSFSFLVLLLCQVDGTEEESLMDSQGVTGYPTLKLYRKGQLVPYTGGRMAPEMVSSL